MPPTGLAPGQIDAIQQKVLNLGHSALQPYYHRVMEPLDFQGRHILILWAPGGPIHPYKARLSLGKTSNHWGYFIRKGSNTIRAKGHDEHELLGLAIVAAKRHPVIHSDR